MNYDRMTIGPLGHTDTYNRIEVQNSSLYWLTATPFHQQQLPPAMLL